MTTADQPTLSERFVRFDAINPFVYAEFKRRARQLKGRFQSYSAWTIVSAIRFDIDAATTGDAFKINNDFIALYARKLIAEDVSFEGFFNTRRMSR